MFRLIVTLIITSIVSIPAAAQGVLTSVGQTANDEVATPIPGGHDYQKLLGETVNPAGGAVSFKIQYPMPKGRGIDVPVSWNYDSAGQYRLTVQYPENNVVFVPNYNLLEGVAVTWAESTYQIPPQNCGGNCTPTTYLPCNFATSFTFSGLDGVSHNLGLGLANSNGTPSANGSPYACPVATQFTQGTDGEVWAQFTNPQQSLADLQAWNADPQHDPQTTGPVGPFTVTDKNGLTYFFNGAGTYNTPSRVMWAFAYQVEDRNGNLVTTVDTLGRPNGETTQNGQVIGGITYPNPTAPAGAPSTTPVSYSSSSQFTGWSGAPLTCPQDESGSITGSTSAWGGYGLPDGTQYTLYFGQYNPNDSTLSNPYGLLNEITFPGGGWIKYKWMMSPQPTEFATFSGVDASGNAHPGCFWRYSTPVLSERIVSNDGVKVTQTQTFTYTINWASNWKSNPSNWSSKVTTVQTTDNIQGKTAQTIYTYSPMPTAGSDPMASGSVGASIPVETSIQYYDWGNTTSQLKTVSKGWCSVFDQAYELTTVNGLTSGHIYRWDPTYHQITDDWQYPYGTITSPSTICYTNSPPPSGFARHTQTTYKGITNYVGAIFAKPLTVTTYDGGSNRVSETDYAYDGSTLGSDNGAVQHDDTNYGPGNYSRGNVTKITKRCVTTGCPDSVTTFTYDTAGQVTAMADPCANAGCTDGAGGTTSYSYVDSPSNGNAAGPSDAYVTQIVYPKTGSVNHIENFSYNYTFGDLTLSLDENNQTTAYKYGIQPSGCNFSDAMDRLGEIDYPDKGVTTHCYDDAAPNPTVTTNQLITSTSTKTTTTVMDGMFHVVQTQLSPDPDGNDYTDMTVDGLGKAWKISNPHRTAASSTDGITRTDKDVLDRPFLITEQDGSAVHTSYSVGCTANNNVLAVTVIDEAGNYRRSCTDGLGRLVEVDEPGTGVQGAATPATGTVTIGGSEQSAGANPGAGSFSLGSGSANCVAQGGGVYAPQYGTLSLTIGSNTASTTWSGTCSNTTETLQPTISTLAANFASAITNSSLPVTATAGGTTIYLTARTTGATTNYSFSINNTTYFSPSQGGSGYSACCSGSLSGGSNGGSDSGTVSLTVDGYVASQNYGSSDTASTIASGLAATLNSSSSPVTAALSGTTITLVSKEAGSASNYSFSTSNTWNTQLFSSGSFSASASGSTLTGGSDPAPLGSTPFVTLYTYDILDNLLQVQQKGATTGTTQWRTRTFTYDSLSRLLCAANPEVQIVTCPTSATGSFPAGAITYAYDVNGNVITKTAPLPNQTVATSTVTTTYSYDQLNRLLKKSYNDGKTATVQFGYDGVALTGCKPAPPVDADTYAIGRRTAMCDGSGATSWKHDSMGRVLQERRTIGAVTGDYETDAYNLAGLPTSVTSLGYSVTYTYSGAGRALSATNQAGSTIYKYVSGATYAPPGELTAMTLGATSSFAGIVTNNAYNDRLQPILLSAAVTGQSPVFSECFDFHLGVADSTPPCSFSASTLGNNGNVYQIVNNRDTTRSELIMYDSLNRIQQSYSSGSGTWSWGETFGPNAMSPGTAPSTPGIDAWGNLSNRSGVTGKTYFEPLSCAANPNNQLPTSCSYGYDAAGNMTSNGTVTYVYDAENRLIATNEGYSYIYDGDGQRVEKCTEGSTPGSCATGATGTLYWRGTSSDALSETNLSGTVQNTYVFFNGQRVARLDSAGLVHYYFSDQVGSHGVVENATATSCEQDIDYYPYGGVEHDYCSGSGVAQNYKFTGKERDAESGLDEFGARYYGSSLGRFMTPDWATTPIDVPYADFGNPQSLNLYSYVKNNPTTTRDPDGHCPDACVLEFLAVEGGIAAFNYIAGAGVLGLTAAAAGASPSGNAGFVSPGYPSYYHGELQNADGTSIYQRNSGQSSNAQSSTSTQGQSTPAQPDGTNGLPKPPTGKGSTPPEDRDPKRTFTKSERQEKLDQQNGKCAQCGKDKTVDETNGHHVDRHADGGQTNDANHAEVCKDCHKELHKPDQPN